MNDSELKEATRHWYQFSLTSTLMFVALSALLLGIGADRARNKSSRLYPKVRMIGVENHDS